MSTCLSWQRSGCSPRPPPGPGPGPGSGPRRPSAPLRAMVAGLGDVVAALEAADVLSPLSPVPARLATLCASLDLDRHGHHRAARPPSLPAPWLSPAGPLPAQEPEPAPAARRLRSRWPLPLPELDGIRLTLLGLLHAAQSSSPCTCWPVGRRRITAHRAASTSTWPSRCRSGSGTAAAAWHAARSDRSDRAGSWEATTIRPQLVPPLTRPTAWAEIISRRASAEVLTTLPLRREYPS